MLAERCEIEVIMLETGDKINIGDITMTVLSPEMEQFYMDENAASLVLYMECGGFDALFMGDAGAEAERSIINQGIEDVTLLKVGHHGSAIETNTEAFIEAMNPAVSVISCGKNNVYGHPHEQTIHRLETVESNIWITSENGVLEIYTVRNKIYINPQS